MTPIIFVTLACFLPVTVGLSAPEQFKQLADEYWAWRLEDSPELATLLNVHTYANQTERFDVEVLDERKHKVDKFITDLEGIDRLALRPGQRTSYDVLLDTLKTYAAGYRWRFYGPMHPVNFLEGLWNDPKLFIPASLTTYEDFANYAERISGWAIESTSMMERMNKSIEMNTTNHIVSIEGVVSQIDSFLGTSEMDCVLYEPFNETLDEANITDAEKETLRNMGKASLSELREEYKVMKDYVEDVYMNHTRDEVGVGSFEKGNEYYKACLKWHLSIDMPPKAIHRLGLREVERISRQMKKIVERLKFDGSIREFFNSLTNNSNFIANNEADVITMYEDIITKRIGPKLEEYFGDIPDMPVKVEPMPNDGPGGSYTFGSPDGAREGVFYVNTFRRKDNPTYAMVSLALHEADPGHHMQDIFSQSAEGLPDFRKVVDDSKYFSPPLHFPIYTAYLEGWALYSESLGEADYLDVYKDDYELMGRYSEEIFRACRLVVDTGLHYYDWSREKAINYMMNYTTISRKSLSIEINRYITWPGQACAYKVGELKIKDLRSRSKALLGKDFDIKQFHSVILKNGAVPLDVLENLVMDWTKDKRRSVRAGVVSRTLSFHELIKEYWQWRMEDAPEFASSLRVKDYADMAEQYNVEVLQLRKETVDDFLTLLNKIDRNMLNNSDKVSYEVLKDTLTTFSQGYIWKDYGPMNPVNFLEGFLTEPSYYGPQELEVKADFENYISRLQGFVNQVDDFINRMQIAIDENTTNNWVSMTRAIKQFETFASKSPNETALLVPFLKALGETTISDEDKKSLTIQAESVMMDLQQNYIDLKDFLEKEYQPNAREEFGVSSFKDGEKYYRACLKWHLSVDLSPEEIHQKGLDEVARIHTEMLKVAARLNFTGSTKQFFASLENDRRFFLNSSEEVIARYTDIINNRVKPKLGRYFRDIPDMPVKVEPMPYDGPGGSYTFGTPDGSKPGVFYVNVKRPTQSPTYEMVALALHEADPGHHLQDTYAQASVLMPIFRRVSDYTKYFAVPVHYPFYTAYTEGWALYAESLGEKEHLDIYQDDYELMGRYSSEIFRACRLVVDTGLHHYNWTREQSIQYMLNYTSFSREAMELEIDRYITWPGQACAYKIGEMKIKELRQLAEVELGEDFDMRDFHSVVLNNGAVPLNVLEQLVNDWITKNKKAPDTFEKVANDFFEWRKMDSPEFSSGIGYKYNDRVDSYKYEKFEAQKDEATKFRDRLMSLSRSDLSKDTQVSYDVLKDTLTTFLEGFKWIDYQPLNPINFLADSLEFERFGSGMPFDTQGDFINYVRRVELLPDKYQEMINLTRRAIENGHTNHNASLSRVKDHLEGITMKNITDMPLYRPFNDHGVKLFGNGTTELMHVQNRLKDALQKLKEKLKQMSTFVTDEYMPKSRPGLGIGTLPNGRENYKACLKWHTSLDISPEEVHIKGKAEVARIVNRIHESMEILHYNTSWSISQLYAHMRSDEKFLLPTPEKTLSHFRDIIFKRIQPKIQNYFSHVPNLPLEIEASVSDGIGGQYVTGSADGSRPGTFIANVHRKEDNPTFTMISLSLHEAIPGHHLAESYAQLSSIPNFRKFMEWRSDSVPYFFPFYNAYVEGWALYSEYLGEEMGIYEDHYELLGRFSHEMHRACRLVVDTGIHYYNWTRDDAIAYMLNYTAMTPNLAAIEIDRYATWPGQACGYKMGEIKIKELRERAEQELGDRFDLRDFHYTVLKNGPMPIGVLETVVGDWIESLRHPDPTVVKFSPGCTSRAPLSASLGLLTYSLAFIVGGGMWV